MLEVSMVEKCLTRSLSWRAIMERLSPNTRTICEAGVIRLQANPMLMAVSCLSPVSTCAPVVGRVVGRTQGDIKCSSSQTVRTS